MGRYAVVGCSECSALWIVDGRPETTNCRRCGARHRFDERKKFVTTDDETHAREVRASMLANRQGYGEAFAELDSFDEMEATVEDDVVDDEAYLAARGADPEAVAAAEERAERGHGGGSSKSETIRAAVRELPEPTAEEVVAYAAERGVEEEYARRALDELVRAGDLTEHRGRYRAL